MGLAIADGKLLRAGGWLDQPLLLWRQANYAAVVWQMLERAQEKDFLMSLKADEVELNKEITAIISKLASGGR